MRKNGWLVETSDAKVCTLIKEAFIMMKQFNGIAIPAALLLFIGVEFSPAQMEGGVDVNGDSPSDNLTTATSVVPTEPDFIALPNPVHDRKEKVILMCRTRFVGTALINIYDAVGSIVFQKTVQLQQPDAVGYRMCVPWDCRNRNGRMVGNGTYLGVIRIFDLENRPIARHMVNIGIAY